MVTEGDAIRLVRFLQEKFGGETRSHQQFGTAKWLLSTAVWERVAPGSESADAPMVIDFVTARTEFYDRPTALPEVERGSIKLDLHRRDFTINTLAVRLDGAHLGELLDFYGGFRDLDRGIIRVLHSLSFVDDPTRIMRAIRLEQRLGFEIEPRTRELIEAALPMLNRITGDRIRNELEMCLREKQRVPIMASLAQYGVLAQIHPGLAWHRRSAELFHSAEQVLGDEGLADELADISAEFVYFAILMLPLAATVQQEVMDRLKVRKMTREDVIASQRLLVELSAVLPSTQPSEVYKMLQPYRERVIVVCLAGVKMDSDAGRLVSRYLGEWRYVKPRLNGNDLLQMGLDAGPEIGMILQRLLDSRLDGEISHEAEERALVMEMRQRDPKQS
jgi:tRNA nucleotidyltransferase (CCA-adding enzyme)